MLTRFSLFRNRLLRTMGDFFLCTMKPNVSSVTTFQFVMIVLIVIILNLRQMGAENSAMTTGADNSTVREIYTSDINNSTVREIYTSDINSSTMILTSDVSRTIDDFLSESSSAIDSSIQETVAESGASMQELNTQSGVSMQELNTQSGASMQEFTTESGASMQELTTESGVSMQEVTTESGASMQELTTESGASMQEQTTEFSMQEFKNELTTESGASMQELTAESGASMPEQTTEFSVQEFENELTTESGANMQESTPGVQEMTSDPDSSCEGQILCLIAPGFLILNASLCTAQSAEDSSDPPVISATTTSTKVAVILGSEDKVECTWKVEKSTRYPALQASHLTLVLIQLNPDQAWDESGKFLLEYTEEDTDETYALDLSEWQTGNLTLRSPASLDFLLHSDRPHLSRTIVFALSLTEGAVYRTLPSARFTENSGHVTSFKFDGLEKRFLVPVGKSEITLDVSAENQSIFVSFTHFFLGDKVDCDPALDPQQARLDLKVGGEVVWSKCGTQEIPSAVYRSSLTLELYVGRNYRRAVVGFRMVFAVMMKSQEPQQVSEVLYNCSVPYFDAFSPVLRCNMAVECYGGEDEEKCEFNSKQCGDDTIDAGNKCYTFHRNTHALSWNDAKVECLRGGQRLVTMATPDELDHFQRTMQLVKHPVHVYVGLRQTEAQYWPCPTLAWMYRHVWLWSDERTAFYLTMTDYTGEPPLCAYYSYGDKSLKNVSCNEDYDYDFVCEVSKTNSTKKVIRKVTELAIDSTRRAWNVSMAVCPAGHVIRDFLSCDFQGQCGAEEYMKSCTSGAGSVTVAMFACQRTLVSVHYTQVCDHVQHCTDNSDEEFCVFQACPVTSMKCRNSQCVPMARYCDGTPDCSDISDEACGLLLEHTVPALNVPFLVNMDGMGQYTELSLAGLDANACPDTHFGCLDGVCLPVYLRCNGVDDCVGREDEADCDTYICPGYYRCRGSKVCVHPDNVCDGVLHCPKQDDELLCDLQCPEVCHCQGLAFVCSRSFSASSYPDLRYLDASGSDMVIEDVSSNELLIFLSLSRCQITELRAVSLPNLRTLDLSWNRLTSVDMAAFSSFQNLVALNLSGNPIAVIMNSLGAFASQNLTLYYIDLSYTDITVFNDTAQVSCPYLKAINLSRTALTTITDEGFRATPLLEILDTRDSPLANFPQDVLRNLYSLKAVYTDNYKLCCPAMLPQGFDAKNCQAKQDLLASCEDLLKSNIYRIFLWLFAALAIAGNVGSFVARVYLDGSGASSFGVFVTNLSLADFLMGVYLAIIGTADLVYRGRYLFYDLRWKHSLACSAAGFMSLLSSEVSAFNICLITLDRFLVLRFPFSPIRFNRRSAIIACGAIWVVGLVLVVIPIVPATSDWRFFSQTGMCIPLPFTGSDSSPSFTYSFTVLIILNFILFVFIASGQAVIYWSVRVNSIPAANRDTRARDVAVARRLTTVVISDFLCWFPIGLLGVLATAGVHIPDELNVVVAIFVLPFNSALNPFLYTLKVVLEKRRKSREAKLLKKLENRMVTKLPSNAHDLLQAQPHYHKSPGSKMTESIKSAARNGVFQLSRLAARSSERCVSGGQPRSLPLASDVTHDEAVAYLQRWLQNHVITTADLTSCLPLDDETSRLDDVTLRLDNATSRLALDDKTSRLAVDNATPRLDDVTSRLALDDVTSRLSMSSMSNSSHDDVSQI